MRSASGDTAEGLAWIENGIDEWRATGAATAAVPYYLALKLGKVGRHREG